MKRIVEDNIPVEEGVYLVRDYPDVDNTFEIDVYSHPVKGLSCYADDFGSAGTGVNDETDCHVSVQNTGLIFIKKVGEI